MSDSKAKNKKPTEAKKSLLRERAEKQFTQELEELAKVDNRQRPRSWNLSPWAVTKYVSGRKLKNGFEVSPKYIGDRRIIEIAVATLTTDRALLLIGVPDTGKSWASEHLAAAISSDSTLLIEGTAGTSEEAIGYGWNCARLLADGPSMQALVATPLMRAMEDGKIARVEELTCIPADVQDTLITVLVEKTLPIREMGEEVQATKGFSVIATANDRGKGVNGLSSALNRHFNNVVLPLPKSVEEEVDIVQRRVASVGRPLELPAATPALEEVRRRVTIFRELRSGVTADGKDKIKSSSSTKRTAEAISVVNSGLALEADFGDGYLRAGDLASKLIGAVIKDRVQDRVVWREYLETVAKERKGWKDLYRTCREAG